MYLINLRTTYPIYKNMNKKRAQAWGYDLIAGLTIFVMGIFVFFLFSLNYNSGSTSAIEELEYEGEIVGDSLLSEGYPNIWNYVDFTNGDVEQIGILTDGKVNQTKLDLFYNVSRDNYQTTRGILNIRGEYWVSFSDILVIEGETVPGIGNEPDGTERNIIKKSRVVSYNGKVTVLDIFVWN